MGLIKANLKQFIPIFFFKLKSEFNRKKGSLLLRFIKAIFIMESCFKI